MRAVIENFEKLLVNDIVIEVVNLTRATHNEADQLKKNLDASIENNEKKIIVDLSHCEFIDPTFLGVLVLALKSIAKIGGDIRLVKPDQTLKDLTGKNGTLNVFNIYESVNEAVKSFEIKGDQNYYLGNGAPLLI
ncbi:MAG TPA: hypothetical protein DHV28_14735 [Ignavibacteriales bacterium]|nr:hypothetical protein [Ignavibacteriales bacterium]